MFADVSALKDLPDCLIRGVEGLHPLLKLDPQLNRVRKSYFDISKIGKWTCAKIKWIIENGRPPDDEAKTLGGQSNDDDVVKHPEKRPADDEAKHSAGDLRASSG